MILTVCVSGCSTSAHDPWPLNEESLAKTIGRSTTYQAIVKRGATPRFFIERDMSTQSLCAVFLGEVGDDFIHRVATLGFRRDGSIERLETTSDGEEEWIVEVGPP
ncbi:MAG TPA: hypothetical protein VGK61_06500 [Planctomycetota bacterium]|jgi:hypothetical protein